MSGEVRSTIQVNIRKGNLNYQSFPASWQGNIDATNPSGPAPGAIQVTTAGVSVVFNELVLPSYCILQNLDLTNFVSYGLDYGGDFLPLGEVLPGELYVIRLSRLLGTLISDVITGTGAAASGATFFLKAEISPVNVFVGAFEA